VPGGKVLCAKHGLAVWQGHVECSKCRAVFQTQKRLASNAAPVVCACGETLMPKPLTNEPFTARCICPRCYDERSSATLKGSQS
jgi:hypothetical protein